MDRPSGPDSKGDRTVLFVCTGNTCRSPLAEAIFRGFLKTRGRDGVRVLSAGSGAATGSAVSEGALVVAREAGLDLSALRSTRLDEGLVEQADLILAMEPHHRIDVLNLVPSADQKLFLLTDLVPGRSRRGIGDPYGGGSEDYRRCFEELSEVIAEAYPRLEDYLDRPATPRQGRGQ